ncbi:MAG: diacylglycerol kinase family protein [Bacteroidales bacterium]|nr:diacylglycerol kinase family protein [Bacteroidales bacterium]
MKEENQKFSLKKRLKSFKYAFQGLGYLFKTQHNAWIHLLAAVISIILGLLLKISLTEWCLISFAMGLVISAELINTSVEYLTDLTSPGYSEKAKRIKDMAAASVLIAAITAAIIGVIIFVPKIIAMLS